MKAALASVNGSSTVGCSSAAARRSTSPTAYVPWFQASSRLSYPEQSGVARRSARVAASRNRAFLDAGGAVVTSCP
jgi:hypothetical protein